MNFIKYMLIISVFSSYLISAHAQYSIEVDPENASEIVHYLYELYEDQIELPQDELHNFIMEGINSANFNPECNYSPVEISAYELDYLTFSWEAPLDGVEYFEHRSLNLQTGETSYENTDEGVAMYDYNEGFFLFMFNSACSSSSVSRAQIIIVDKDVMLNGPPAVRNCTCINPITYPLSIITGPPTSSSSSGTTIHGHSRFYWPLISPCVFNKYIIEIEDPAKGYNASAFIIHEPGVSPQNIYLHPSCSYNFIANSSNYTNPGDSGKYFLSFTKNQFLVNLEDFSIVQNGSVSVKVCSCSSSGRSEQVSESKEVDDSFSIIFQNPVKNQMNLKINIPDAGTIKYHFRDINGRQVGQVYIKNVLKGSNQFDIPLGHLPSGIYSLITNYKGQQETRKVVKVN